MTNDDIKNKIAKLREDIKNIEEKKNKLISDLDNRAWEISRSIRNLLNKLSLQTCRFRVYSNVMFKGKPARIDSRNIDDKTFEIYYTVNVNGVKHTKIYDDDPDLDFEDLSGLAYRKTISERIHHFIERFNPLTSKWRTKEDWKEYSTWIKMKNYKDIVVVIRFNDNHPSTYCFTISNFFNYKVPSIKGGFTIVDIFINGRTCRYCKLSNKCERKMSYRYG